MQHLDGRILAFGTRCLTGTFKAQQTVARARVASYDRKGASAFRPARKSSEERGCERGNPLARTKSISKLV